MSWPPWGLAGQLVDIVSNTEGSSGGGRHVNLGEHVRHGVLTEDV